MNYAKILNNVKPSAETDVVINGSWVNELGSTANFTQTNNVLSGTYTSSVSGAGDSATGSITGYVNGNVVSFIVTWSPYESITAWIGFCNPGPDGILNEIVTLWQMGSYSSQSAEWESINAGADTFTPS